LSNPPDEAEVIMIRSGDLLRSCPVPLDSGHAPTFLSGAYPFRKTGAHSGPNPGQAFSGIRARVLMRGRSAVVAAATLLALAPLQRPAQAQQPVEDFYRGRTVTLTVSGEPGGGYDTDARVVARHLGRFIPGNPRIVVSNLPLGRGLINANRLYSTAPKDGSYIGLLLRGLLTAPWLDSRGVEYDINKFNWLISTAAEPGVAIIWKATSTATVKDLRTKEIIVGGSGDSAIIPQVFNYTMGTKFKLVLGYQGTAALVLAMERGEIDGIGYYSLSNILTRYRSWLTDNKVRVLLQTGERRNAELGDVPLVSEFALDETRLQIQRLWLAPLDTARPFAMPPDVPPERVVAVRHAFGEMLNDAQFRADAKASGMVIDPRTAEQITAMLARLGKTSPAILEAARKAVQG
jgi:tripartite-type tricarboxylate transporter receptor subunit TctC